MALFCAGLLTIGTALLPASRAARPELAANRHISARGPQDDVELVAVQGRSSMAKDCEPFPGKRVVLVTVSSDFLSMFTNWLRAAKPFLGATEQLEIMAMDYRAVSFLEAFMHDQELNYSLAFPQEASALLDVPFGSKEYGDMVWKRPDHMLNLLEAGCSVMYVDIDTVWMKDPFRAIEAAGSADFYVSDDVPEHPEFHNLCTCFMFLHPAGSAKGLMHRWAEAAEGNSNQAIFNRVLQGAIAENAAPLMQVLPVEEFPPGSIVIHPHNERISDTAPSDPTMWHANWRVGKQEKIHFFTLLDQWKPTPLTVMR